VKETGAHAYYKIIDEESDLSFLYTKDINLENQVKISYFVNNKKRHKCMTINYSTLKKELVSKNIFMFESKEKEYAIRFSGAEFWVFSFSKEKAESIFKLFDIN
tara:strand:+ start:104 stop:415 length:312 start_codon:yes stop_codon:yes gene_type:complete